MDHARGCGRNFNQLRQALVHARIAILRTCKRNTATGNTEEVTYVSVIFDRATFNKINLDAIDPSDALSNFEYNMKFGKTTGFKPVVKLTDW